MTVCVHNQKSHVWKAACRLAVTVVGTLLLATSLLLPTTATDVGDAVPINHTPTADAGVLTSDTNRTDSLRPTRPAVSYGLRVLAARDEVVFAGLCGNEISFTADDFRRVMNLSEVNYITISELPSPADGTLFVGSMGASVGQVISAGSLSLMSFAAADDTKPCDATMRISVNGSDYDVLCRLYLLEKLNYTPTVALASSLSLDVGTYRNVPLYGACSAYDPEGDEVTFEVVRYASHGRVSLSDKHTGAYVYTPDSGYVGTDSFDYVVRDKYGNYSTSATVSIRVEATPDAAAFADIENHTAASSIIRACSTGLMNGTRVGATHYFKPTAAISRAEFLVTAMHAARIGEADVAAYTQTPFADDASIPVSMRGYVALAAERKYISGKTVDGQLCFCPDETISRAEAAVILSNIIGYATEDTVTAFADAATLPAWSTKALTSLSALGILVPMDGNAYPAATMTRADAAEWLTRTVKLING